MVVKGSEKIQKGSEKIQKGSIVSYCILWNDFFDLTRHDMT